MSGRKLFDKHGQNLVKVLSAIAIFFYSNYLLSFKIENDQIYLTPNVVEKIRMTFDLAFIFFFFLIFFLWDAVTKVKDSSEVDKTLQNIREKEPETYDHLKEQIALFESAVKNTYSFNKIRTRVSNNLNKTIEMLNTGSYFKPNFKPQELFDGTSKFSIGVSTADIDYLNDLHYMEYLCAHYDSAAPNNVSHVIHKSSLLKANSVDDLIPSTCNSCTKARFYIYHKTLFSHYHEFFRSIFCFSKTHKLNAYGIHIEDIVNIEEVKLAAQKANDLLKEYCKKNMVKLPTIQDSKISIPDFLINDQVAKVVVFGNDGPEYIGFQSGSNSEYGVLKTLLDTIIKNSNFANLTEGGA